MITLFYIFVNRSVLFTACHPHRQTANQGIVRFRFVGACDAYLFYRDRFGEVAGFVYVAAF